MTSKLYTRDALCLMGASFFFMFSTMLVTPLINGYSSALGAHEVFAGVVTGSMSIIALILRPLAGNLSDHISKYRLSVIGSVLIFIGVVGYCISPSSQLLLLFRLVNGVGFVLATVCMTTWLSLVVPREHVGEAMGMYGLMNALAMALAPAIGIALYNVIGYRETFVLGAIAAILVFLLVQCVQDKGEAVHATRVAARVAAHDVSQDTQQGAAQKDADDTSVDASAGAGAGTGADGAKRERTSWMQTFRGVRVFQKNAFPITLLMLCFSMPYFATQADLVEYLQHIESPVSAGLFFIFYAIILLVIRLFFKRYFDRVRYGVWFWMCFVATIAFLISMMFVHTLGLMILSAGLLSVGYGIIYSVNQATAMMLAPMKEQGLASSTFYFGIDLAMVIAPILGGCLFAFVPIQAFYPSLLAFLPVALIVYYIYRKQLNQAVSHRTW